MFNQIRPAIVIFALLTIITGGIYPLIITAIAHAAFPNQAGGSVISVDGKEIGSSLIAQHFSEPKYFWSRPSACDYDATAGSGTNLGPTNPALADAVKSNIAALRAADVSSTTAPPIDLVTSSGSGLDPHISVEAAKFQAQRVATARHSSVDAINTLIDRCTESRTLGLLGEPRVNVLRLNLALDHPGSGDDGEMVAGNVSGYRARGFLPQ